MTRLNGFDRFEQRVFTLLGVTLMYGVPLGTVAATHLFLPTSLSWFVRIPLLIGAYVGGFFLMFVVLGFIETPIADVFAWIRKRTGRKPLTEIERQIKEEQQEAAWNAVERAQKVFVGREYSEQFYALFQIGNDALRHLKSIHSLLQSILLTLIIFVTLSLIFWIVRQYSAGAFPF
jgi:hypothetical protein